METARRPDEPAGARVEPQFLDHVRELWSHRAVALAAAAVVAIAVFVVRNAEDDRYEATATVWVRPADTLLDADEATLLARTYAELASGTAVLAAVATATSAVDADELESSLDAELGSTAGFIDLVARGDSPTAATELANAWAAALAGAVASGSLAGGVAVPADGTSVLVVEPAEASSAPVGSQPWREALLAFVLTALVVGELLVLVRWLRGRLSPVAAEAEAGDLLGAPVFRVGGAGTSALLLRFVSRQVDDAVAPVTVVQVGRRPTVAGALAVAVTAARSGDRAVVVDVDRKDPVLADELGVRRDPGLADVLVDGAPAGAVVVPLATHPGVSVIPAGTPSSDRPGRLRTSLADALAGIDADLTVLSATTRSSAEHVMWVLTETDGAIVVGVDPHTATRRQLAVLRRDIVAAGGQVDAVLMLGPTGRTSSARAAVREDGSQPERPGRLEDLHGGEVGDGRPDGAEQPRSELGQ